MSRKHHHRLNAHPTTRPARTLPVVSKQSRMEATTVSLRDAMASLGLEPPASPSIPISPRMLAVPEGQMHLQRLSPIMEVASLVGSQTGSNPDSNPGVRFNEKVVVDQAIHKPLKDPRRRGRGSLSPPASPTRFLHHVSFDNFAGGEPTAKNTISFTLNVKHKGYQYKKRSRTFMVGLDEHLYSDIALQWTIDELVDDGDEIICLRVIDKDAKIISDRNVEKREYQKEAKALLEQIQLKNDDNRAIGIILEFAVGKLHDTFQQMIQLYEPAMLVVGTRGRSLGGFQGLVSNRNSFSKWLLQYSPIPVVVVRPTEMRVKKKEKRQHDPTRKEYARILKESGVSIHETDVSSETTIFEPSNDADQEAHLVASALNLPARFDPTIKPFDMEKALKWTKLTPPRKASSSASPRRLSSPQAATRKRQGSPPPGESPAVSEVESSESGDDDDGDFEVTDGHAILGSEGNELEHEAEEKRRKKLHQMEVDEAKALASQRQRQESEASMEAEGLDRETRGEAEEHELDLSSNWKGKQPEDIRADEFRAEFEVHSMSDPSLPTETEKAETEVEVVKPDTR